MLIFFEAGVLDCSLNALERLLALLDQRYLAIVKELSSVSEESPLHEEGDDIAGFGFVACQRYLTEITKELGLSKADALAIGPTVPSGRTVSGIVNTAANAWKHEAEWDVVSYTEPGEFGDAQRVVLVLEPGTNQGERTLMQLSDLVHRRGWDYKYVNALHAVTRENRLSALVPLLAAWRDAGIESRAEG